MTELIIKPESTIAEIRESYWACARRTESPAEAELLVHLALVGVQVAITLPKIRISIQPQHQMPGLPYRLDFLVRVAERQIAFEADGLAYHSDQEAFARDRKRDRELALSGLATYRYTALEIMNDPTAVRRDLFRVLTAAITAGHP